MFQIKNHKNHEPHSGLFQFDSEGILLHVSTLLHFKHTNIASNVKKGTFFMVKFFILLHTINIFLSYFLSTDTLPDIVGIGIFFPFLSNKKSNLFCVQKKRHFCQM